MKKFYLGTNWKMHKDFDEAKDYINALRKMAITYPDYQYFIIPPHTHLSMTKDLLENSDIFFGAQNSHWLDEGAYTGEISPKWIKNLGANLVELGHSERREYYNENDYDLSKKVKAVLKFKLIPLLCIGENAKEKEFNVTEEILRKQLKIALFDVDEIEAKNLWIAYEPVWAIGVNGVPASAEYVEYAHGIIRDTLIELFGEIGEQIPIFYGGSVNPQNCVEIAKIKNIDGLFIGRSAWDIKSFEEISDLIRKEIDF